MRRTLRTGPRQLRGLLLACLTVALLAAGCTAETTLAIAEPDGTPSSSAVDAGGAVGDSSSDSDSSDEPSAQLTVVDASDIYDSVVDSIVFIDAVDGTGTGIVIEGGWILTNAHVVDRLGEVRIGRSDGVDLGSYPVHGTDWVFDLALVGPVDDDQLVPFERVPSDGLAIGDPVMLIGFPDERNLDPTPTLTSGIVSRRRQPALGSFPYLQVDATIAGGQSGGALVGMNGELFGISGLEFGEGEFGLAFEADAMWPRVDQLLADPAPRVPTTNVIFETTAMVGPRSTHGFLLDVDDSGDAAILAVGDEDLYIDVRTLTNTTYGDYELPPDPFVVPFELEDTVWYVDELLAGGEELVGTFEPGLYQVLIGSFAEAPSETTISSSNGMIPLPDIEEGAQLDTGAIVEGLFDWPGDSDSWTLDLIAGSSVTIVTDGLPDMILSVRFDDETIAASDDLGIGLFGSGSRVEFVAPFDGIYEVEFGSFDDAKFGYLVLATVE